MAKKPTLVEINGRTYNADTGRMVTNGAISHKQMKSTPQVIDGFAAPHRTRKRPADAAKVHQAPQKTKKLHPTAAKQAKVNLVKKAAAKVAASDVKYAKQADISKKVDSRRAARAKMSAKSSKVQKFSKTETKPVETNQQPAKLVKAPAPQPVKENRRAPEVEQEEAPSQSLFARWRQERPRLLPTVAGVGAILLLVGWVTYMNLPNMALRVAASRAGFEATLPGYKPSGFNLSGPIAYSPGQIALNFSTNSDDRAFQLTQRESTWDSQSLLDNFVVRENKRYVTFQESGLTVYVYDDSNATWVDKGIWYTIEGDSLLSSEQLLKIATSL